MASRQGVASMFVMASLLGVFASIPQSDYLSLSDSLSFSLLHACILKKNDQLVSRVCSSFVCALFIHSRRLPQRKQVVTKLTWVRLEDQLRCHVMSGQIDNIGARQKHTHIPLSSTTSCKDPFSRQNRPVHLVEPVAFFLRFIYSVQITG